MKDATPKDSTFDEGKAKATMTAAGGEELPAAASSGRLVRVCHTMCDNWVLFIGVLATLSVIVMIVVLSVFLGPQKDDNQSATSPDMPSPSASPSASPTSYALGAVLDAMEVSAEDRRSNSSQFMAAIWLVDEDGFSGLEAMTPKTVQRYVLATFYFATGGDMYWKECGRNSICSRRNDGVKWLASDSDECDWFSVSCNENGTIQYLEFPWEGNGLVGTLPAELSLLTGLEHFLARENQLTGNLAMSIKGMPSLQTLALGHNKLTGTLSSNILVANPDLEHMDVGGNRLTGTIPEEIALCTQLTSLDLGHNHLAGTIPSALGELSMLAELDLQKNNLTGTIPEELFALKLTFLSLGGNNALTGNISTLIGQLTALSVLQLGFTSMGGSLPDSMFKGLLDLSELNLEGARFSGAIPEKIRWLNASLMDLFLGDNEFSGSIPVAFDHLTALETLQIQGNLLTGTISQYLCEERGTRFQQLAMLVVDCDVECGCCDSRNELESEDLECGWWPQW